MVDVSRRWFLGGALGVATAAVLPKGSAYAATLYGDGIHDDTKGLQALLDGKPVLVKAEGIVAQQSDGRVVLSCGSFRISDTIYVRAKNEITHCSFHATPDFKGSCVIDAQYLSDSNGVVAFNRFVGNGNANLVAGIKLAVS